MGMASVGSCLRRSPPNDQALNRNLDAKWETHGEKRGTLFLGWLSLKGNPYPKKGEGKKGTTGQQRKGDLLWMVAKSISHHRSETLVSDSIPLETYQQTLWIQPWFQGGAEFCPSTVGIRVRESIHSFADASLWHSARMPV